jgi:hypothetical protein
MINNNILHIDSVRESQLLDAISFLEEKERSLG